MSECAKCHSAPKVPGLFRCRDCEESMIKELLERRRQKLDDAHRRLEIENERHAKSMSAIAGWIEHHGAGVAQLEEDLGNLPNKEH